MSIPFTAVLLAGGASRRMGVDKALLPVSFGAATPQPLWAHQLATLQRLAPAEVIVSGPRRPGFPVTLRCVPDEVPFQGPLGGLTACLAQITTPHMLVLAVDLPLMTNDFLARLVQACGTLSGIVPRGPAHYEPLAAVYPKAALNTANAALAAGRRRLQRFVDELAGQGLVEPYPLDSHELGLFRNWNVTEDLR